WKPTFARLWLPGNHWRSQMISSGKLWKNRVSLAGGLHVGRLHDVLLGLVAEAVARVADHRGDLDVGQLLPRRHLAVVLPVQHDVDLVLLGSEHDLVADQRGRAERRIAGGGGAMARG